LPVFSVKGFRLETSPKALFVAEQLRIS